MSYGLLGVQKNLENQSMQGLRQVANIQQSKKMADDQLKTAEHQQKASAVGTGAGLGMMAGMQAGSVGGPVGMAIGAAVGWLASEIF